MKKVSIDLAIKLNPSVCPIPCVLCGYEADTDFGPQLFLADTWDIICHQCGEIYAPELKELLPKNSEERLKYYPECLLAEINRHAKNKKMKI